MSLKRAFLRLALPLLVTLALLPGAGCAFGQTESQDHSLQPGETALDLELFYNLTKPDLDALNQGQNLALAGSGQPITVFLAVETPPAEPPAASAAPTLAPAPVASSPEPSDPPGKYTVRRGDTLFQIATQFGLPMSALAAANNIPDADTIYVGQQLNLVFDPATYQQPAQTPAPRLPAATIPPPPAASAPPVPQPTLTTGKQIMVVLSEQMAYAFQDGQLLRQFLVSTGLPGSPTVLGSFAIYVKYDSQRMVGPGYDLPGVPWVMYFYRGYALHGTYWHHNFGHPMSHGCVNMQTPEAEWVYNWAPIGTPVTVIW